MSQPPHPDLQGPTGNTYDKYGTRNPLARRVVVGFLCALDAAVRDVAPASVLDVGCGEGVVTERIAGLLPAASVVGLDVADPELAAQWRRRSGGRLRFRVGSAYALPYPDDAVDLVCAVEVLEHLERPAAGLAELARVARRAVIVSTPREPAWRVVNALSGRHLRTLGNTPGHVNHFSRRGLARFAAGAGRVTALRTPFPWTIVTLAVGAGGTAEPDP